ncbi:MAG TPA: hypothetical protein VFZ18_11120 [Longimicrobiaceae bacterium]
MIRTSARSEGATRGPGTAPERGSPLAGEGAPAQRPSPTGTARLAPAGSISGTTTARLQAAVTALAPALMAAGLLYHPHIGTPFDTRFLEMLAAAVAADPDRWALAHLLVAVGSGLLILAFLALRARLRAAGEERWSVLALPFVVMGSVLFALLPAMEFAPLAAAEAQVDIAAVQAALLPRFTPILRISAVVFAIGAVGFAAGIVRSALLSPALTWLTAGALVVMAATRFVPLAAALLYIGPAAGIVAFWPLAYWMWRHAESRVAP